MAIIRNRAKCLDCGVTVESTHVHHWVQCDCGHMFVDGGKDYLRRGFMDESRYEELSEMSPDAPAVIKSGDEWTDSTTMGAGL